MKKIVINLIFIIFFIWVFTYKTGYFLNPKFNSKEWKSATPNSKIRFEMLKHLYRTHEFIGMEKKEVLELFGEPDIINKNSILYILKISEDKTDTTYFAIGIGENKKVFLTLIGNKK